jgi:hypothetical protein
VTTFHIFRWSEEEGRWVKHCVAVGWALRPVLRRLYAMGYERRDPFLLVASEEMYRRRFIQTITQGRGARC